MKGNMMIGKKNASVDSAVGWIATVDALLLFLMLTFLVVFAGIWAVNRSTSVAAAKASEAKEASEAADFLKGKLADVTENAEKNSGAHSQAIKEAKEAVEKANKAREDGDKDKQDAEKRWRDSGTLISLLRLQIKGLDKELSIAKGKLAQAAGVSDDRDRLQIEIDELLKRLRLQVQKNDELAKYLAELRGQEAIHQELLGVGGKLKKVAFIMDVSKSMGRDTDGPVWKGALRIFNTWVKYLPVDDAVLIAFGTEVATFPNDGTLVPMTRNGKEVTLPELAGKRPSPLMFSMPDGGISRQGERLKEKRAFDDDSHTVREFLSAWLETVEVGDATATKAAMERAFSYRDIDTIILFTDGQPSRRIVVNEIQGGKAVTSDRFLRTKEERDDILRFARTANASRSEPVVINVVALGEFHCFDKSGNFEELKPLWQEFERSTDGAKEFRNPVIDFLTQPAAENHGSFCAQRPVPFPPTP
jgi:hypothetical protein